MNQTTDTEQKIMSIENNNTKRWKINIINFFNTIKININWFRKNRGKVKILIPISIISTSFMIYMIVNTFITINNLNKKSEELYNIKNFDIDVLEKSNYTKDKISSMTTLNDLISYEVELSKEIEKYNNYLTTLQSPYSNFMKNIFLPELNIRKNPFTNQVDTSIIGAKYLEKNPYNDIKLIEKRSNFIKNVGNNNEFNEVEEIIVGDMVEENEGFYIPINIKFISNSKRSFLLLVEKLSATSNKKNISLINEFIYNLWDNIKENKTDIIEKLEEDLNLSNDEIIGYHLYRWIFNDKKNELLDNKVIDDAIKEISICGDEKDSFCFYKFRDKYRGIPSLAYTIGIQNNKNKVEDLKKFLKDLAPIIKINKFTFERNLQQNLKNFENIQYKGEIQMNIYGMGVTNSEIEEISTKLGIECIGKALTPNEALKKIEETLTNVGYIVKIDTNSSSNLRELQTIIENINKEYNNLGNYKKVIKLFEIYRMMKDNNLCEI